MSRWSCTTARWHLCMLIFALLNRCVTCYSTHWYMFDAFPLDSVSITSESTYHPNQSEKLRIFSLACLSCEKKKRSPRFCLLFYWVRDETGQSTHFVACLALHKTKQYTPVCQKIVFFFPSGIAGASHSVHNKTFSYSVVSYFSLLSLSFKPLISTVNIISTSCTHSLSREPICFAAVACRNLNSVSRLTQRVIFTKFHPHSLLR